jgi:hypothetical protein
LDLALDVIVPPLSRIVVLAAIGVLAAWIGGVFSGNFTASRVAYGASLAAIFAYVFRGWMVSGTGMRGLVDLGLSPVYVAWKLTLARNAPARTDAEWVRTARERSDETSAIDG